MVWDFVPELNLTEDQKREILLTHFGFKKKKWLGFWTYWEPPNHEREEGLVLEYQVVVG
jgi:hypothetical protein